MFSCCKEFKFYFECLCVGAFFGYVAGAINFFL